MLIQIQLMWFLVGSFDVVWLNARSFDVVWLNARSFNQHWEVIWRVPCKIYPDFFKVLGWFFFLIYKYDTKLFSTCHPEKTAWVKNHPSRIWVDFSGYPSNHFLGCRLNGGQFIKRDKALLLKIRKKIQHKLHKLKKCFTVSIYIGSI